jgi:hypothetical protein
VDWNLDGYDDLMLGDADGRVNYYMRLEDGELTEMPDIESSGSPISVFGFSSPDVVDWNSDGLPDLVIGSTYQSTVGGTLLYYQNKGTPGVPEFSGYELVEVGGFPVTNMDCKPHVVDFSGDGLIDVFHGEYYGEISFMENVGIATLPEFETSEAVTSCGETIDLGTYSSPFLVDWNSDGILDLLCGEYTGSVLLFMGGYTGGAGGSMPLETIGFYPNPLTDTGTVLLVLRDQTSVDVRVVDACGRLVGESVEEHVGPGSVLLPFDASTLPSGIYFVEIAAGDSRETFRVVVLD